MITVEILSLITYHDHRGNSSAFNRPCFNPLNPASAKINQYLSFLGTPRAGANSLRDFAKSFGSGKLFQSPFSTTNGHPIFRGPVRYIPAPLTRIFGMLASSAFFSEERSAIFAHDTSPGGVRLSGGTLPDVTRLVRYPSRGEDLGKDMRWASLLSGLLAEPSGRQEDVFRRFLACFLRVSRSTS